MDEGERLINLADVELAHVLTIAAGVSWQRRKDFLLEVAHRLATNGADVREACEWAEAHMAAMPGEDQTLSDADAPAGR
jgi:hypothetical protein